MNYTYGSYTDLTENPLFASQPRRIKNAGIIQHPFSISRNKNIGKADPSRKPETVRKWDICDLDTHEDYEKLVQVAVKVPKYQDTKGNIFTDPRFSCFPEKYSELAMDQLTGDYLDIGLPDTDIREWYHVREARDLHQLVLDHIERYPYLINADFTKPEYVWFLFNRYRYEDKFLLMISVVCNDNKGRPVLIDIIFDDDLSRIAECLSQKYADSVKYICTDYIPEFDSFLKNAFPQADIIYSFHNILTSLQIAESKTTISTDKKRLTMLRINLRDDLIRYSENPHSQIPIYIKEAPYFVENAFHNISSLNRPAQMILGRLVKIFSSVPYSQFLQSVSMLQFPIMVPFEVDELVSQVTRQKSYYPDRLRLILLYASYSLRANNPNKDTIEYILKHGQEMTYYPKTTFSDMAAYKMATWSSLRPVNAVTSTTPLRILIELVSDALLISEDLHTRLIASIYFIELKDNTHHVAAKYIRNKIISKIQPTLSLKPIDSDLQHRILPHYFVDYVFDFQDGETPPQTVDKELLAFLRITPERLMSEAVQNAESHCNFKKIRTPEGNRLLRFGLKNVHSNINGCSVILTQTFKKHIRKECGRCYLYMISTSSGYALPMYMHSEKSINFLRKLYMEADADSRFDDREYFFDGENIVETGFFLTT